MKTTSALRTYHFIFVALLLIFAAALAAFFIRKNRQPRMIVSEERAEVIRAMGRETVRRFDEDKRDVAAIFADAVRVEPLRLDGHGAVNTASKLHGFPVLWKGDIQDRKFAAELGDVVLDGRTYGSPGRSVNLCWFEPDVAFRVVDSKGRKADVMITIQCKNLIVIENNAKVPLQDFSGSGSFRFRVGGDFTGPYAPDMVQAVESPEKPPAPRIFALMEKAFPNDVELQQKLKNFSRR